MLVSDNRQMDLSWAVSVTAVTVLFFVIVLLGLVLWSVRTHRDPDLHIQCDVGIDTLMASLAGLTLGTSVPGNSVEIIENGKFWDVLEERIGMAKKSIHYETFLWKEGKLGKRMAKAFAERAKDGVKVRIMLDANGSGGIGKSEVATMEKAGVNVHFFHRKTLRNIGVLNDRTHRKMLIIDGKEAFVGGHCVVDEWLGDAEDGKHYGDVSVRLRGPIVHSVQGAFSENWAGSTGELFAGPEVFPAAKHAGEVEMHAGLREAGKLRARREDPPPHRHLPREEAHLDPEPVLHPRARCDRCVRRGREARRGGARADAVHQRLRQPDGAARGPSQLREAPAQRRAPLGISAHAAAPEGDDDRRHLQRRGLVQFRRPLLRDQRRDHGRHPGRGDGRRGSTGSSSAM